MQSFHKVWTIGKVFLEQIVALLLGYLLGSIPFGLLLARAAGLGDIRQIGSGNIGATNVLRTGNKSVAAATLLLDGLKGFVAVLVARHLFGDNAVWLSPVAAAALGAVLGHCFPLWLKFRGGKGVATNLGVTLGIGWPIGLAYATVWLAMLGLFRISSVAGMSAVVAALVAAALLGFAPFVPVLAVIAALVIWLHRANIVRLREGTEPRIGSRGSSSR
jgi:glycerol-3-phosphate acyltransferase PlsY